MDSVARSGFGPDLRLSPVPAIVAMLSAGVMLGIIGGFPPHVQATLPMAMLLVATSALAWLLYSWRPELGSASVVAGMTLVVLAMQGWSHVRGALAALVVPTALCATLLGSATALICAAGESALVLLLWQTRWAGTDLSTALLALGLIWSIWGLGAFTHTRVQQLAAWSFRQSQLAQESLRKTRDQRAERERMLRELVHANQQLSLINEKLAIARRVAEDAQKAKAVFAANVSHELRTPLNMIGGMIEIMLDTPYIYGGRLPTALVEDLEIVRRNCDHLSALINDVLDLSQLESGRLALHKERVNLTEIVERSLVVIKPLLEKKRLQYRAEVPADLPEVYCDRTRIRQVIINLLSNAARYTESGQVSVRAWQEDQNVVVSVSDTGPGIPPDDAARVFEPFYQGARALRATTAGSGLGLSISKHFVDLHDGRMWLKTALGQGTTFYFSLPISPPLAPTASPLRMLREDWVWFERTERANLPIEALKPRIVVCDETGVLCPLLSRHAAEADYVETRCLSQAVQEAQRCAAQAMVINAPAHQLWPRLDQARALLPDVPIIGCALPAKDEAALAAGAQAYLLKPVTQAMLYEVLDGLRQHPRRVLVVDDDEEALHLFRRMLEAYDIGLEVYTANSGALALEQLRTIRPHLLLLDIVMPGLDGWQVLAAKNEDESIRSIPVILVSAQDPHQRPLASSVVVAAMGEGVSIGRLIRCSQALVALLLRPESELEPTPPGTAAG